jgi:hypothetical protein
MEMANAGIALKISLAPRKVANDNGAESATA